MPSIRNLQDLLVHQLRDLYSAEKQLVAALPKLAKQTTSAELEAAMTSHLKETTAQVGRLEQVFEHLGVPGRGPKCKAMEGLVEEGKAMLEEDIEPNVLDAGIIASAQRMEHYEIASYGTAAEFARVLGHEEVMHLLRQSLDEEKSANETLTQLAEGGINALAQQDGGVSAYADADDTRVAVEEAEAEADVKRASSRVARKDVATPGAPGSRSGVRRR